MDFACFYALSRIYIVQIVVSLFYTYHHCILKEKRGKGHTYLGSTCSILKSSPSLTTNMSGSSLSSLTDGGGNAMATPTRPIIFGGEEPE